MKIMNFTRHADGTATPTSRFTTTWDRVQPEHLKQIYGGQQVDPAEVHASPPPGFSLWQARDGRIIGYSMSDAT